MPSVAIWPSPEIPDPLIPCEAGEKSPKMSKKRYSNAFKEAAVAKVRAGTPIGHVARECGVTFASVAKWVRAADDAAGPRKMTDAEHAERKALRKRVRQLEEEKLILKKPPRFWRNGRSQSGHHRGSEPRGRAFDSHLLPGFRDEPQPLLQPPKAQSKA